ncbi:protein BONZAI 3-like [Aristolochia californica]|uniref:protein BONZAI 3-like n=1 Tax=Aristolochia californica TaxID=171875 RepID=UPI0035DA656F
MDWLTDLGPSLGVARIPGIGFIYTELVSALTSTVVAACGFHKDMQSDPRAVVYAKKSDGTLEELGHPVWISQIGVLSQFETSQPLVCRVYDVATQFYDMPIKALKVDAQEFLCEGTCVLSEIVTKQSRSLTLHLQASNFVHDSVKYMGTLIVRAEEIFAVRKLVGTIMQLLKEMENPRNDALRSMRSAT